MLCIHANVTPEMQESTFCQVAMRTIIRMIKNIDLIGSISINSFIPDSIKSMFPHLLPLSHRDHLEDGSVSDAVVVQRVGVSQVLTLEAEAELVVLTSHHIEDVKQLGPNPGQRFHRTTLQHKTVHLAE